MAFKDILDRHDKCEVVIIPRYHKNRPRFIHGLYCANHCKLIKWLSPEENQELIDSGVELLEPIKEDKMKLLKHKIMFEMKIKKWVSGEELGI